MSKIDDLINKLCPDGVEYYSVKEFIKSKVIFTVTPSFKIKRNDYKKTGLTPIISQEIEYISGYCNKNDVKIMQREYVCFGDHSENVKYVDFAFVQEEGGLKIICTDKSKLIIKYFYYSVLNFYKRHNNYERHFKYFCDTIIPIPPLEIQREIVRILDSYSEKNTQLIEELYAEMDLRKKQYEYYRDMLLNFDDSVEWWTLGEIATEFYRGSGIKRDELTENGTPCIRYGEIYTTYGVHFNECVSHTDENNIKSKKYMEYGDILFAITGESVEDIAKSTAYLGTEKCLVGGDIVVMKHQQNPKYLSYALSTTNAKIQKSKGKAKNKVVHSSVPAIKEIKIPVPPIEEQERIVKILDRFDSLFNDLTSGIPAEISVRQKQYEYYRDKLLHFKIKST